MHLPDNQRRHWLAATAATAATAALLPLREAVAQTRRSGGDWLEMVKAQHVAIARTFDALVANTAREGLYSQRDRLLRTLAFQLTAHSVAEENALYPALAMSGLTDDADRLYLDQAHAKVLNARLQVAGATQRKESEWLENLKALQAAVLQHAKGDEEGRLYPKLHDTLDAQHNAMLTDAFEREFVAIRARTWAST